MLSKQAFAVGWRASAVICAAFLLSMPAIAGPPPPNDLRSNATVVSALPFTEEVDTTGATTSADDFSDCFNSINDSVWYTYTAAANTQLVVDTLGTDYPTFVAIIYDADPNIFSCSKGHAVFGMGAGITVSIMISDAFTAGGGKLALAIYAAAPPPNDLIGAAATISALPYKDVVDVTGATTDADDLQVNETCGFFLQHTVWYVFTAGPDDTSLFVDTTDVNEPYSEIIIATGSPGALTTVACGGPVVAAHTTPGTTYYVMIGNGSARVPITVSHAPPEPAISFSLDRQGTIKTPFGTAKLTGMYECVGNYGAIFGAVTQMQGSHLLRAGNFNAGSDSFNAINCDGNQHSFNGTATPYTKREVPPGLVFNPFVPGELVVNATASACNVWGCFQFILPSTVVQLAR